MKKTFLTILLLSTLSYAWAQTNTFPSNGNVGIGTISPNGKLDVRGDIYWNNSTGQLSGDANGAIELGPLSGNGSVPFIDWHYGVGSVQDYNVRLMNSGDNQFIISTASSGTVFAVNGRNVGIGTTTPQALLDVGKTLNSGDLASVLARLPEGNTTGGGTYLGIKAYDTQPNATAPNLIDVKSFSIEHSFFGTTNSSINFLRGNTVSGGSISFSTDNNSEKMRILYNGNVGIGTTNPDAKLAVKGTIHATEVLVDQNVPTPDYVFDKDYSLASLKDVKTYIDQNHHLPEIPSAEQVAKEGINLGEMNAKLLKKIEELTLYLIENDKQDKRKEILLQSQNERLSRLEKELKHYKTAQHTCTNN